MATRQEQSVESAFKRFDEAFATIKPGEVKKMNEVIAILAAVQGDLNEVGATNVPIGNQLAEGFNSRMRKVEELSKVPAPKPAPQQRVVASSTTQSLPPPQQPRAAQPPPQEEDAFEVSIAAPGELLVPADVDVAINELDALQKKVDAINQMDVWQGRTNDLVAAWNAWQQKYGTTFVKTVRDCAGRNPRVKAANDKYQGFSDSLRAKIQAFQITEQQKGVINRVTSEYDTVVDDFKKNRSQSALTRMEALDRAVRELGMPTHPAVVAAIQSTTHALKQMRDMLGLPS